MTVNTFTQLLRALSMAARASPDITIVLLEVGIINTLYQILRGVLSLSRSEGDEQGNGPRRQGFGGGLADMTVMQNLACQLKIEQLEETQDISASD
jgi:E3 ubiquitin-protein ligase TRIP12